MPFVYDWPDELRPASVEWGLITPQWGGRSAFDGSAQAQTLGAPRWFFTMSTGVLRAVDVPKWEGFIDLMRGQVNRARVWDWRREAPLGTLGGTPTLRIACSSVVADTQGWTPGSVIKAGTYLGINGELKRLSVDAGADGAGRSLLTFWPPPRQTAPSGGAIVLIKPTAKFMLMTERVGMPQQGARHQGWTLAWEEDLAP